MAIIKMTAQEARIKVRENNALLQKMYDVAPFTDEDSNTDSKPVARGIASFKEYIEIKKSTLNESVLQT